MNEQFRMIAQNYCGMTPKDKGCKTWGEMQQKMADELEEVVKNFSSNSMLSHSLPLAVEFGYKQCEKGNNLNMALTFRSFAKWAIWLQLNGVSRH